MPKRKKKESVSKFDKYFKLTWRKAWIVVIGGFASILLHNLFYALFGFEEAVFLIIVAIIIPLYVIISIIYSLIKLNRKS
ncbi:hypothetical protein GOV13_02940 [Candidatus Pacearchaeota archaeon]|nr:hypothetical protein [Candidatus Pacearchaeota archaeon]